MENKNDPLEWISKLLEFEQTDLSSTLTSRIVSARNEIFQTKQTSTRAYYGRDALSKVSRIYTEIKQNRSNILFD